MTPGASRTATQATATPSPPQNPISEASVGSAALDMLPSAAANV